jgi:methylmalonyl-CoA/ethylmalonyl-CoA epimerase
MGAFMTEEPMAEKNLHHVGFVVSSIQNEADRFATSIDASWDGKIFFDPLQKVKVTFLRTECREDALVELVEPAGMDSPVVHFLERGGGLHHLCYEVTNLDSHLAKMRAKGAVIVRPPLPSVAFDGRRISWIVTRQKLLLEFLERSLG